VLKAQNIAAGRQDKPAAKPAKRSKKK
jgi:hypothetical protein